MKPILSKDEKYIIKYSIALIERNRILCYRIFKQIICNCDVTISVSQINNRLD